MPRTKLPRCKKAGHLIRGPEDRNKSGQCVQCRAEFDAARRGRQRIERLKRGSLLNPNAGRAMPTQNEINDAGNDFDVAFNELAWSLFEWIPGNLKDVLQRVEDERWQSDLVDLGKARAELLKAQTEYSNACDKYHETKQLAEDLVGADKYDAMQRAKLRVCRLSSALNPRSSVKAEVVQLLEYLSFAISDFHRTESKLAQVARSAKPGVMAEFTHPWEVTPNPNHTAWLHNREDEDVDEDVKEDAPTI